MRIVVSPDSFKGSLTASEAAAAITRGIQSVIRDADIIEFSMADGGEGTLAMIAAHENTPPTFIEVPAADGATVRAPYCVVQRDGRACAVIESASIVGMGQAQTCSILDRSTRGIGRLMRLLLDQGLRSFVLALGGSATNDGGAGLLAELGAVFFDSGGHRVAATARGLLHCAQVDFATVDARLADSDILALADVDNPLAGPSGASKTFGPQKGLANADTERVDAALARFGELCDAACGENLHNRPGSGAAGGLGYAVLLLGGKLVPGAVWLAQRYRLAEMIEGADWVITGEGRTDAQTLHGKAPLCVAEIARAAQVPVSLLSGRVDAGAWPQLSRLFHDYQALAESADDAAAMQEAAQRLERAAAVWAKIRKQEKSNPDSL